STMTSRASAAVSATRAIRMPRLPRRALSMTHSDPTRVFPYPRPARISQNDQFQVGVRCLGRAQKLHWYSSAFFSSSLSDARNSALATGSSARRSARLSSAGKTLLKDFQLLLEGGLRSYGDGPPIGAGELLLGGGVEPKELRAPLVEADEGIDGFDVAPADARPDGAEGHLAATQADVPLHSDVLVSSVDGAGEHSLKVAVHGAERATELLGDLAQADAAELELRDLRAPDLDLELLGLLLGSDFLSALRRGLVGGFARLGGHSRAREAFSPVRFCQRSTMTSQYLGSSSVPEQARSICSASTTLVPEPRNGSSVRSPRFVLLPIR